MRALSASLIFLCSLLPVVVGASESVVIEEWVVPWPQTRPRDPFDDGNGRTWFVGQTGDYVAYLDSESGEFERYDLEKGVGPHNLIVDDRGRVWYAGNRTAHIGIIDINTGDIEKISMPDAAARDPHTLVFGGGDIIWFTVQHGNFIGRLNMRSKAVDLVPVPTAKARPYGIVVHPGGQPWFTEFGSYKLGYINPGSLELVEVTLPRTDARPRRLSITSDGAVWYVDYAQGYLGRVDPNSDAIEEWQTPGGDEARPYGMIVDRDDRLWFVECGIQPNRLIGFDPEREAFFSVTEIESGGGCVRHMHYDPADDEIWFATDVNTVGRAAIGPGAN